MSALTDVLPARARAALYVGYSVVVLVLGAIQVGYGALDAQVPPWLTVALVVAAYVGAGLGLVATANTPRTSGRHAAPGGD